jgi:hypothetical protein
MSAASLVIGSLFGFLLLVESSPQEPTPDRMRMILAHDNTSFPLTGKHKFVDCGSCHIRGVIGGTPETCEACHWDRRQDDPNRLQLGTQCADCHTTASWARILPGAWDHRAQTGFALEGSHASLSCEDCHTARNFSSATAECVQCHRDDFISARAPDHQAAAFPETCEVCHLNQVRWQGARFDHDRAFALRGAHQSAECGACHRDGVFAGTPSSCFDCHRADYERATNPNHLQAGFPTDCASCHGASATSWETATFDHARVFPLKGMHQTVQCSACHPGGNFTATSSECVDCHRGDYERTSQPNHLAAGFSTSCVGCHGDSATSWSGAAFEHDRFFPLNGRHRTVDCTACHVGGRFAGTPSACIDCHRADYDSATSPNHRQAGFSTDCTTCHGTGASGWTGASFNHNQFFPLQGAHRSLDCQACHARGYDLPRDCFGCHAPDYNAARNPDHVRSGFPTSCVNCHFANHTSWNQAVFRHDFPIDNGPHARLDCVECHQASTREFSCTLCHEHEKRRTDEEHREVGGYQYNSQACYACHPNGRS